MTTHSFATSVLTWRRDIRQPSKSGRMLFHECWYNCSTAQHFSAFSYLLHSSFTKWGQWNLSVKRLKVIPIHWLHVHKGLTWSMRAMAISFSNLRSLRVLSNRNGCDHCRSSISLQIRGFTACCWEKEANENEMYFLSFFN